MARYIGPKTRLSRRFNEDLGLKTNSLKTLRRLNVAPGQHGLKGHRKPSQYAIQLKEKQKLKALYGILEKQLLRLYKEASVSEMATGAQMLTFLEMRLDNVIYRLGWAKTRATARQLVNHGHFLLNGKKATIPSLRVKVGDVITVKGQSGKVAILAELIKEPAVAAPEWLEVKGGAAKVAKLPEREQIKEKIEEQLIVEFYSR